MSKRKERSFVQQTLPIVEKKSRKNEPFYNTIKCQRSLKSGKGTKCKNMAYFALPSGEYVCGQHSAKEKKKRRKLLKDPNAKSRRASELKSHEESVEFKAEKNRSSKIRGTVECYHMKMMESVPLKDGTRNVFPNNKHEKREDGYGCCALSPMRLGPVQHRQPGLPVSKNIENYHQFNKVWPCELDHKGDPTKEFKERRKKGYEDPEPHRHKFDSDTMKRMRKEVNGENGNQPCFSVHLTLDGKEKRFTYVQSRYFYCCAYEKLAKETKEYAILKKMLEDGYDLRICGYDAQSMNKDVYWHYCDPKKPFGHESVLFALLTINGESDLYPWHRYKLDHPEVYENIASVNVNADADADVDAGTDIDTDADAEGKKAISSSTRLCDRCDVQSFLDWTCEKCGEEHCKNCMLESVPDCLVEYDLNDVVKRYLCNKCAKKK